MKAYGHSRKDKIECKYGCCTYKSGKKKSFVLVSKLSVIIPLSEEGYRSATTVTKVGAQ